MCEVETGDSEAHWSANLTMLASSSLRDCVSKNKDGERAMEERCPGQPLACTHTRAHANKDKYHTATHIPMRAHTK